MKTMHSKDYTRSENKIIRKRLLKCTFANGQLWMKPDSVEANPLRTLIREYDEMYIYKRSLAKEVDAGSHPFTDKRSWMKWICILNQCTCTSTHMHIKRHETLQFWTIGCKSNLLIYSFSENVQFVSGDNLSHMFLKQHDVVSYKIARPMGARKKALEGFGCRWRERAENKTVG